MTLPTSYRRYITTVGDGFRDPYYYARRLRPLEDSYTVSHEAAHPGFLAAPFPHTWEISVDDFDDEDEDFLVTGSMEIAVMSPGVTARLVVTGEAAGQVWEDGLSGGGFLRPGPDFALWIGSLDSRGGAGRP